MPIFEYKCNNCGIFENLQLPSEKDLVKCPKCSLQVEKLMSSRMGVVYKGSGYYCVDNAKHSCEKCD